MSKPILIAIWKCKCCGNMFTIEEGCIIKNIETTVAQVKEYSDRMTHDCDEGGMNPRTGFCELVGYQVKL